MGHETNLPITVVVPVRKEPKQLAELLPLLEAFERVIIVESGDEPTTRQLATSHGADYRVFRWCGGYPKKRTWAIRTCEIVSPWTLFLDADERPTPAFIDELRRSLPRTDAAGYWLTYDTVFLGRRLRFGVRQRKLALMRTGAGEYEEIADPGWTDLDMEVHEHLVIEGSIGIIRSHLVHLDCKTVDAYVQRHHDYATWEAGRYASLSEKPDRCTTLTARQRLKYALVASPMFPLIYLTLQYVFQFGFLDGGPGLRFALLKAGYFAEVGAKIAEHRRENDASLTQCTD